MNTRGTLKAASIAVAACLLVSCSGGQPPAASKPAEIVAMPAETGAQLAQLLNEFDPAAFGTLLTDNARLLPANVPAVEGRDAIVEHYKGAVASELDYEVTQLNSAMVGNVGIAEGTYKVKNVATGNYVEEGKYLSVWVNQDGQWKVARMMTNTDFQVARTSVTVEEPAPAAEPAAAK